MQAIHLITNDESAGAVRVDRFPEQPRAVHTLNIHTANFVGTVTIEATIKLDPQEEDWFVLHTETFDPIGSNESARRNVMVNKTGRFISMRASSQKAEFTMYGIVNRVTVI